MTLDEKIKQALEINSEWKGSSDQLWQSISTQLGQKKRWWQRQNLWLGTAVAATVLLFFMVQAIRSPLPPELPEADMPLRMQTFSSFMVMDEPLMLQKGAPLELVLERFPLLDDQAEQNLTLLIFKVEEDGTEVLSEEVSLPPLGDTTILSVTTPTELGTYRILLQGTVHENGEFYSVFAEQRITLYDEEGR